MTPLQSCPLVPALESKLKAGRWLDVHSVGIVMIGVGLGFAVGGKETGVDGMEGKAGVGAMAAGSAKKQNCHDKRGAKVSHCRKMVNRWCFLTIGYGRLFVGISLEQLFFSSFAQEPVDSGAAFTYPRSQTCGIERRHDVALVMSQTALLSLNAINNCVFPHENLPLHRDLRKRCPTVRPQDALAFTMACFVERKTKNHTTVKRLRKRCKS